VLLIFSELSQPFNWVCISSDFKPASI
jgi:hypothetical protein